MTTAFPANIGKYYSQNNFLSQEKKCAPKDAPPNRVEKIHLPYSPRGVRAAKLLISFRTPAHKKSWHDGQLFPAFCNKNTDKISLLYSILYLCNGIRQIRSHPSAYLHLRPQVSVEHTSVPRRNSLLSPIHRVCF